MQDLSEIIKQCIRQDRTAQRKLYEKFSGRLLTVCRRYIADDMEAEDLLLQSFLKIFEKLSTFRFEGSFEGWLKRIVVNECLNFLRKKHLMFVEAQSQERNLSSQEVLAEDIMGAEELMQCVQKLPDGYRTVFNLYALEGYSHQEIAKELGISEGTSKSQLSRARTLLQKYVEALFGEKNISETSS